MDGRRASITFDLRLERRVANSTHGVSDEAGRGVWLPLAEAAGRLGLSIDTVRRRAKDGTYPARKERSRYGPAYRVLVVFPLVEPPPAPDGLVAEELLRLVERINERSLELARRIGELEAQLAALKQRRA